MAETRLPAKLARPRLFDAVERERLFALLQRQRERPLIWVAGPPGSGKTTLVTTWLARERVTTLWYRVDEGDADAATFFSYLAQGAYALTRKRKLALPALTPEYLLDLPGFARRYFRTLFDALPKSAALVLDSYESATGSALDALLAIAVAEAPPGVRLVVTSREAPPMGLAHLEAKGSLALVPWEELRLTAAEAKTIAGGGRVPAASVETLHTLSDGWAAGFVVLLEHVRRSKAPDPHASGALRESLFAYFVNEMFARADGGTRTVLVRTALMPGFTGEQAHALCPETNAQAILERLYRQHYFIDRSTGSEPVYRYHALFQDFLLEQGRSVLAPDERTQVLEQVAGLLESGGRTEEALAIYTEARAWPQATKLICELAPALLGGGRNAALDKAIRALPQSVLAETPWLSYWLGVSNSLFNPPIGRGFLEAAYARFEATDDAAGCVLACAGIMDSYYFEWTDVRRIDRWGKLYEAHARRAGASLTQGIEARVMPSLFTLFFRADVHAAFMDRTATRALEIISLTEDPVQRVAAAGFAGWILAARGDWVRIRQLVADVEAVITPAGLSPLNRILWLGFRAWQAHQQGIHVEAAVDVERAESVTEMHGIRVLDVLLAGFGVYAALSADDLVRAQSYISKMRAALHPARVLDAANCDFVTSLLELARNDASSALRYAQASIEKTLAGGANLLVAECRIAAAHALLQLGQMDAALSEAQQVIDYATAARHDAFEHAGLMLKSDALRALGRRAEALEVLRKALVMGRKGEYVVIFPWAPAPFMQRVFGLALDEGIEVSYVRDLIRKLNVPAPETAGESWPWPVRIYTLGRFEIVIGETKVEYRRKLPKRPLAVLKFLLARRGQARVEQAIDALWAQEEADAAANALDAALHRLRRLLGGPGTVESHDGQLTLDRKAVWVDAFAFEWTLDSVEGGSRDLYRQALESYRGHFLAADQAEPWSISTRERLRSRFIRAVAAHGQALQGAREFETAAAHYARAIDVDDLIEAFYQGLMQCQLALKQRSEGLATYQRLRKTLAAGLALEPAAASEQLHAALRAS